MFKFMFLLMEVFHYVLNRSSNGNILLNGSEVFIYRLYTFPAGGLRVDERAETCKLRETKELH
jgi:ADP-ribose pyrophosphatase YjhB (NUDIX family)